jgi:hypothetical protein
MNNGDAIFKTLTGDDWKRGLALARATPNDASNQIRKALANQCRYPKINNNKQTENESQVEGKYEAQRKRRE